jgi:hypothetical protein
MCHASPNRDKRSDAFVMEFGGVLGPQLATVNGDHAHCRTDVQAHHYLKDRPDSTLTLWATYETDMQRIGGEWKIQRHRLVSRGTRVQAG